MTWGDSVRWCGDTACWYGIPERMRSGIVRYIEEGVPPGHFLLAVFRNDLMEAVERADAENSRLLVDYATFLSSQCPRESWGSVDNVHEWVRRGGLKRSPE